MFLPKIGKDVAFGNYLSIIHRKTDVSPPDVDFPPINSSFEQTFKRSLIERLRMRNSPLFHRISPSKIFREEEQNSRGKN